MVPLALLHRDFWKELHIGQHNVGKISGFVGDLKVVVNPIGNIILRNICNLLQKIKINVLKDDLNFGHLLDGSRDIIILRVIHDEHARGTCSSVQGRGAVKMRVVPEGSRHVVFIELIHVVEVIPWINSKEAVITWGLC